MKRIFSRKGAKAQRKALETLKGFLCAFAPLRLCAEIFSSFRGP
jgi:hypothetical protein